MAFGSHSVMADLKSSLCSQRTVRFTGQYRCCSSLCALRSYRSGCLLFRRNNLLRARSKLRVRSAAEAPKAPPLSTPPQAPRPTPPGPPSTSQPSTVKILYNRVIRRLSNLKLAIAELAAIAGLSAVGTVIDQNMPYEFYVRAYPEGPDSSWLTYKLIVALELDHIYTSPYFLGLLLLLAASLTACTLTRQWPAVKVARRWRFQNSDYVSKLDDAEVLSSARVTDLARLLNEKGYQVFVKGGMLYGFKGMLGKLGPIGVHASMLAIMAGATYGGVCSYRGSLMIPEGSSYLVAAGLNASSPLARLPPGAESILRVDSFDIEYRSDGSVQQFYTDISLLDFDGSELYKKQISVNYPLRYGGLTLYQTDWTMAAVDVRVKGKVGVQTSGPTPGAAANQAEDGGGVALRLPMTDLGLSAKTWGTFLPVEAPTQERPIPRGISILAQDFQSVALYDSTGKFIGVRRPGSGKPITIDGVEVVVNQIIGSSGIEAKVDPGVPFVYAGFGGLILTTAISYLSHNQVWAAQQGSDVYVGGKSGKDKLGFSDELSDILDKVPEVNP